VTAATEPLDALVARLVGDDLLTGATLSKPRGGDPARASKVTLDPVDVRAGSRYRWRHHHATRTIDETLPADETARRLTHLLGGAFRQGLLRSAEADYQVLAGGKGVKVLRLPPSRPVASREHDRRKTRLLPEGVPVPFLVALGVMGADGTVRAQRRDKFRQVNRFCELVDDVVGALPAGRLRVVDFGSGRAYLTFALHHLLHVHHGRDVEILGLDLKEDVVEECEALARRLGLDGLRFAVGDIASAPVEHADLVVSLHACDTATDAALDRAVRLRAPVILAVPCCQHELLGQLSSDVLEPLLRHGVLRERFVAEVTDAARARLLQLAGYDVQLAELFALEHSPKNVLIRATALAQERPARDTARLGEGYRAFADELAVEPALERALADLLPPTARQR
jgi:Methyltransferase domain